MTVYYADGKVPCFEFRVLPLYKQKVCFFDWFSINWFWHVFGFKQSVYPQEWLLECVTMNISITLPCVLLEACVYWNLYYEIIAVDINEEISFRWEHISKLMRQ